MAIDEAARLASLRAYRILDTDPERRFDDLTLLASHVCGAPIALLSLVDADRQWFKSRVGLTINGTSRAVSFCTHAIARHDITVIPDAREDPRVKDNPHVRGEPHIRFYAGAPLIGREGQALGTLCVMDRVSRTLTPEQLEALDALRRQAEAQLELRRNLIELQDALAARDRAEAEQAALFEGLRAAHEDVRKLSALIPLCSTCAFSMTVPADPSSIPVLTDGVKQVLQERRWPDEDVIKVELALQEAVANAIRHGCQGDPSQQLQCSVTCDAAGEIMIVVRDPGTGFDPSHIADPLDPANVLKPGGRGIFLINSLMDDVRFSDGGREVTMRKKKG